MEKRVEKASAGVAKVGFGVFEEFSLCTTFEGWKCLTNGVDVFYRVRGI